MWVGVGNAKGVPIFLALSKLETTVVDYQHHSLGIHYNTWLGRKGNLRLTERMWKGGTRHQCGEGGRHQPGANPQARGQCTALVCGAGKRGGRGREVQGVNLTKIVDTARKAAQRNPVGYTPANWREKGAQKGKDAEGEEPQGTAAGPRYQTARHQLERAPGRQGGGPEYCVTKQRGTSWKTPQGAREGGRECDAPRCLPGRHSGRRGVRGLPCDVLARAPGGTSSM